MVREPLLNWQQTGKIKAMNKIHEAVKLLDDEMLKETEYKSIIMKGSHRAAALRAIVNALPPRDVSGDQTIIVMAYEAALERAAQTAIRYGANLHVVAAIRDLKEPVACRRT